MAGKEIEAFQLINIHAMSDTCDFAEDIQQLQVNEDDILLWYDVSALFTNVPLEVTIQIHADKAFAVNSRRCH